VVNGKAGWVLEVGSQRYRIEPQCELGPKLNLSTWSKPDFVIWPWSAASKRKPIAVFCDGWTDHQHSMREDAQKRSAIVVSGECWVWSVTHQDVNAALSGSFDHDLESPLVALSRHDGSKAPPHIPRAQEKAFTQHAVARLLAWLATPGDAGSDAGAVAQLQRNALWLGVLMTVVSPADKMVRDGQLAQWLPRLPEAMRSPGSGFAESVGRPKPGEGGREWPATYVGWWPTVWAKPTPPAPGWRAPGVVVLDEAAAENAEELHRSWRRWLQLFNSMQFLPGTLMVTGSGLAGYDYEALQGGESGVGAPATGGMGNAALLAVWETTLEQTLDALRPGLRRLAEAGAAVPEVGLELADEKDRVLADAELAWPSEKLVVLRDDQTDLSETWAAAQWKVVELDEGLVTAGGAPWQGVVATVLGLNLDNEEEQ
jgi:DEAD/DEAH box helicase domain-containing protein